MIIFWFIQALIYAFALAGFYFVWKIEQGELVWKEKKDADQNE